jgi:hypothetical protein
MKVQELRIGNWVSIIDKESETPYIERQVTMHGIPDAQFYNPIPLSEEWLLKFGFDKFEDYDFDTKHFKMVPLYIKDDVSIMLSGGKYWYVRREYDGGTSEPYEPVIEVDYVHSLQNLFHALTGSELTIKE